MGVDKISGNNYFSNIENVNDQEIYDSKFNKGVDNLMDGVKKIDGFNEIKEICNRNYVLGKDDIKEIIEVLQRDNFLINQLTDAQVKDIESILIDFLMNEPLGRCEIQSLIKLLKE